MERKNELGLKLRKIRRERDMTQEELATLLGTTKQVISRYERGDRNPKFETILAWAKTLQVNVTELIDPELIYEDRTDKQIIEENLEPIKMYEGVSDELGSLVDVLNRCGIGIIANNDKYFLTNDIGGIEVSITELNTLVNATTDYISFTFNKYINKKLERNLNI